MTSEPNEVFVWTWLPEATDPVVAGVLVPAGNAVDFRYGLSYLSREDAVPLYLPELPLKEDTLSPLQGRLAGCIDDAGPDSWGMRVILNRLLGKSADTSDLGPLTYLIESASNRIGALDFQRSPDVYVSRGDEPASLDQLVTAAALVEAGEELPPELDQALLHGTSAGGARPKAVLRDGDRQLIAKFSSTTDTYPVVKAEFVAMTLAERSGLNVAKVDLTQAMHKDVLLVERFDRLPDGRRRAMVSAMTILGLDENSAIFAASYFDLGTAILQRFTDPENSLRELFSRITFNILVGNNDDHARNHAAFWDARDETLTLTPAYDIAPTPRAGGEARQLMAIDDEGWRMSQVAGCVERAALYRLSETEARSIVDNQVDVIRASWDEVCDLAALTSLQRRQMWRSQFLNEYALYDY